MDGQTFEDLCQDLLKVNGFDIIRHTGVGPDNDVDILVEKRADMGGGAKKSFRWLVQCKHRRKGLIYPKDI